MNVCITEKPSIARVLGATSRKDGYLEGNGYQVTWAFGHLCELKAPEDYLAEWKHWKMDVLPVVPSKFDIKLIPDKGVWKQFGVIKMLFGKATEIINCGDAGQEGELIQRWIQQMADNIKCPIKRLWISSLTDDAIREGLHTSRQAYIFEALHESHQKKTLSLEKKGLICCPLLRFLPQTGMADISASTDMWQKRRSLGLPERAN